jgi:hypothetical protein
MWDATKQILYDNSVVKFAGSTDITIVPYHVTGNEVTCKYYCVMTATAL